MLQDQHGLAVSTSSVEAAASFDRTILAYLKYRADTPQHLARMLIEGPLPFGHNNRRYSIADQVGRREAFRH